MVWSWGAYDLGVKSSEGFRGRQGWNSPVGDEDNLYETWSKYSIGSPTLTSVN